MGQLQNNVYLISDGAGTMVVDPSCDADTILAALGDRTLDAIVLTHNHNDHTGAVAALREATGATVVASELEMCIRDRADIRDEEREHMGELLELLERLAPDEKGLHDEGREEVREMLDGKKAKKK